MQQVLYKLILSKRINYRFGSKIRNQGLISKKGLKFGRKNKILFARNDLLRQMLLIKLS